MGRRKPYRGHILEAAGRTDERPSSEGALSRGDLALWYDLGRWRRTRGCRFRRSAFVPWFLRLLFALRLFRLLCFSTSSVSVAHGSRLFVLDLTPGSS